MVFSKVDIYRTENKCYFRTHDIIVNFDIDKETAHEWLGLNKAFLLEQLAITVVLCLFKSNPNDLEIGVTLPGAYFIIGMLCDQKHCDNLPRLLEWLDYMDDNVNPSLLD